MKNKKTEENKKLFLILILLVFFWSFQIITNSFAKEYNMMIFAYAPEKQLTVNKTTINVFIPNSIGRDTLKIYDKNNNTVLQIRFDNFTTVILPYNPQKYYLAKMYHNFVLVKEIKLELCNHNYVCEPDEYLCEDCEQEFLFNTIIESEENRKDRSNYVLNLLIVLLIFITPILIFFQLMKKSNKNLQEEDSTEESVQLYNINKTFK